MLLDLNSSAITHLAGSGKFLPPAELSAAWSPNGQWIAYREAADRNGDGLYRGPDDRNDLWLIRPDGGGAQPVITNSYSLASISWSPDSQHILFSTQDNHMLVSDLQGQIVFDFGGDYFHPSWAP
jgi:Tol biopolymer transport system component